MTHDTQGPEGRVALVTGAATGIGAECARKLAGLGFTVVGLDVDDEQGRATFEELGAPHSYRRLDVSDMDAWTATVADIVSDLGRIDLVHLNAGVMTRPKAAPLLDDALDWLTADGYRKVMSVNLDGVVFGIIAALEAPGLGQIIVTASGAAILPLAMDPYYTASKYGVLGLGLALYEALDARGIRLDILCPGAIGTSLTAPDILASVRQEPAAFIADAVGTLVTTDERGPVWLAFTEAQGLRRYEVPGLGGASALDVTDALVDG
jgi:NAD(P)-dependent dehydrogenase (short-subunit alcohol dehydrogenase family)